MLKYNIALIPSQNQEQFIQYAQTLSSTAPAHTYHIGGKASIPHVSLCHFLAEPEQIDTIWTQVQGINRPKLHMTFDHHRSKSYSGRPKDIGLCWVSLMPDKLDQLKEHHLKIAKIIGQPLNASFGQYDPHMSLFNSRDEVACAEFNRHTQITPPFEDDFIVVLGYLDNVGQITEIIYPNPQPRS